MSVPFLNLSVPINEFLVNTSVPFLNMSVPIP